MATKRGAPDAGGSSGEPPAKKGTLTQFEPIKIGPISTLEEMDIKVLQFQNKKLMERIEQRKRAEEELRKRIEQLEQRQTTDDAVLCIVNRYWNQLDEDARILLQRFDAEGADESENKNESPAVTSFLTLLSQWDKKEIEEKLRQRVEFSKRAIGKLLQAYDRMLQRNEKLLMAIKGKVGTGEDGLPKDDIGADTSLENTSGISLKEEKEEKGDNMDVDNIKSEIKTEHGEDSKSGIVKTEIKNAEKKDRETSTEDSKANKDIKVEVKQEPIENGADIKKEGETKILTLSDAVKEEMEVVHIENKRLHDLTTELHQKHHEITLKNAELIDTVTAAETEAAEIKNKIEDLEYERDTATNRMEKLDRHLADAYMKLKTYEEGDIKAEGGGEGVSKRKFDEIYTELEEQKDLATNRLLELEKLQKDHQEALKQVDLLKMDLSTLPEHVIVETTEYKCLQSQFSVLYNESMQMKTQLEEARNLLQSSKNTHLRQIEQMESDELACQKKLRTEVIQLEDQLAQVRREYEMLRIEFEQTLAANEQTGPINREMRNLITSLKQHNEQLKGEITRYKRKLKEAQAEINKLDLKNRHLEEKLDSLCEGQKGFNSRLDLKLMPLSPIEEEGDKDKYAMGDRNDLSDIHEIQEVVEVHYMDEDSLCGLGVHYTNLSITGENLLESPLISDRSSAIESPVNNADASPSTQTLEVSFTTPDAKRDNSSDTPNKSKIGKGDFTSSKPKDPRLERLKGESIYATMKADSPLPSFVNRYPPGHSGPCTPNKHSPLAAKTQPYTLSPVDTKKLKAETVKEEKQAAEPPQKKEEKEREEREATPPEEPAKQEDPVEILKKEEEEERSREKEKGKSESEIIKDLKAQLKKCQDSQKEMKLLLDMYKSVPKESRDKVLLMASDKKARQEIEELKSHIRKMQEAERKERRKLAEEDAIKKIKKMEETIGEQTKTLAAQKQEEEALLNEMEVTGQAFEDMQEQNIRLLQQLREKDDANFKLMSERIKSNQIHKLLREEKEVLEEQTVTLQLQIETQMMVVKKLEEKERILQNNLATVEKELSLRQQAMEMHKRKAVVSAQTAADLKLHLDKYQSQLKESQSAVTDKTGALESESFKYKRMQEELASLRRKLERAKKMEMASSADEVLMEEIKEYKEQLTCPSCKVKRKDAVLTKCFHVFCLECLRTRYETRQRKCPKCNAAFGANDFHRLYLE